MIADRRAMLVEASRLFETGPLDAAIAAYRRLLRAFPDLPNSWFNLSLLERRARLFAEALASAREALDRGIEGAEEVHLQRGVIYSDDLGDSAAARAELEAALALDPAYVPALLNLGNLEEDIGDRRAAEGTYRRVLAIAPDHALAMARLAGIVRVAGSNDPILLHLRDRLARPEASLQDRADLGFALGAALDRIGAYDEAFAAFVKANEAARGIAASRGIRYDRAQVERFVDRLIATFDASPPSGSTDPEAPLFVCGMFRSGSTLAEQILSRHPALDSGGELDTLPALVAAHVRPYPEGIPAADPAAMRAAYLAETAPRRAKGRRLIDKRPDNVLHIGMIQHLFPGAHIVHTRRAVLDNCLSVYALHADPTIAYATDLGDILHYQAQERRLIEHWKGIYAPLVHELDYDRLIAAPRETITALLDFCGLDWDDAVLDFAGATNAVRTASVWQVRQPLYGHASGRWRNYAAQLGNIADTARALGLEVD